MIQTYCQVVLNKNMINKLKISTGMILMNFFIVSSVHAQTITFTNPIKSDDIRDLVRKILDVVVEFGAIVAVFFLIYAGFLFVKAQGNDSELQKAKSVFFWTIVGGMVVLGAHVLSRVIQSTVSSIAG